MASKAFRSVKEQPGSDRWNEANGNQKKTWNTHDALKKDTDRGGQRGTQESHTCTGPNDEPNSARNAKKINAKPSEMKTDGSLLLLSFSCFSFFFNLEGPSAFRRCASFPFASVYPSIHLGSMIGLMDYLGSACGGSLLQTESATCPWTIRKCPLPLVVLCRLCCSVLSFRLRRWKVSKSQRDSEEAASSLSLSLSGFRQPITAIQLPQTHTRLALLWMLINIQHLCSEVGQREGRTWNYGIIMGERWTKNIIKLKVWLANSL